MIHADDKTIPREIAFRVACQRGFPIRHLRDIANLEHLSTETSILIRDIRDGIDKGGQVIVSGNIGTGKTFAATWIGLGFTEQRKHAHYWTISKLMSDQKDWFHTKGDRGTQPFTIAKTCALLVLDQLIANAGTMYDNNELAEIIDQRYQDMRPTIVLTNVAKAKLAEVLPYHIVDRTRDGGALIELKGNSIRGQA